jgi:hypothetical protein
MKTNQIKYKRKLAREYREQMYLSDKKHYDKLIGIIVTWTPLFIEYYEELNSVMPEFFTNDVIKVLERNANSLYWKNNEEDKDQLAQEHTDNLKEFRNIVEQTFKVK